MTHWPAEARYRDKKIGWLVVGHDQQLKYLSVREQKVSRSLALTMKHYSDIWLRTLKDPHYTPPRA